MVSRARKRKIARTPIPMYEWGGSAPTREAMGEARARMQKRILDRYPSVRQADIEWRVFDGSVASDVLTAAGMPPGHEEADRLRAFIADTSGGQLISASVRVAPGRAAALLMTSRG